MIDFLISIALVVFGVVAGVALASLALAVFTEMPILLIGILIAIIADAVKEGIDSSAYSRRIVYGNAFP